MTDPDYVAIETLAAAKAEQDRLCDLVTPLQHQADAIHAELAPLKAEWGAAQDEYQRLLVASRRQTQTSH